MTRPASARATNRRVLDRTLSPMPGGLPGGATEVYARLARDRRAIEKALVASLGSDETRIEQAFKLARAFTSNFVTDAGEARRVGEAPALELYSDGRIADLDEQVLRGEPMQFFPSGTAAAENVAITAVSVAASSPPPPATGNPGA